MSLPDPPHPCAVGLCCWGSFDPGGQEVGSAAPPWGVVNMFMSWAELVVRVLPPAWCAPFVPAGPDAGNAWHTQVYHSEANTDIDERLLWMVQRGAPNSMPVGEAVDGTAPTFVMTSCPDLYEHGGVFAWTLLMRLGLAAVPDVESWPAA